MKSTSYGLSRSGVDAVGQRIYMDLLRVGLRAAANETSVSTLTAS